MTKKWLLNLFISILALLMFTGCATDDLNRDNEPIDENNNHRLEDDMNNNDRDRDWENNQENNMDRGNNDNLLEDEPDEDQNMP